MLDLKTAIEAALQPVPQGRPIIAPRFTVGFDVVMVQSQRDERIVQFSATPLLSLAGLDVYKS